MLWLGSEIREGENSDPGFRMEKSRIRDPGEKNITDLGKTSQIRSKHPGSATLPDPINAFKSRFKLG
jgi:hypothetical protein